MLEKLLKLNKEPSARVKPNPTNDDNHKLALKIEENNKAMAKNEHPVIEPEAVQIGEQDLLYSEFYDKIRGVVVKHETLCQNTPGIVVLPTVSPGYALDQNQIKEIQQNLNIKENEVRMGQKRLEILDKMLLVLDEIKDPEKKIEHCFKNLKNDDLRVVDKTIVGILGKNQGSPNANPGGFEIS